MKSSCNAEPVPPREKAREGEREEASAQFANDRGRRLESLVEQLRRGEYSPDFDTLARALLEKEPELFGLPGRGEESPKEQG